MRPPYCSFIARRFCVLILASVALGQTYTPSSKSVRTSFLLRMQREERTYAGCVIVYPDHKAHFEMVTSGGNRVLEGPLSEESTKQLDELLPAVRQIDPSEIKHKMQVQTIDIVLVNVAVQGVIQNLQFSDDTVRKPFHQAMDPLLKWFGAVPKSHLETLPERRRNNCMPDEPANESSAPEPMADPRVARAMSQHMLIRANIFTTDVGVVRSQCYLIAPDGQFRYETRTASDPNIPATSRVFIDTVSGVELDELKKLLDAPAMRASTHHPDPLNGVNSRGSEEIDFTIPREDHVQELRFYTNLGDAGYWTKEGVVSANNTDNKLVNPVRNWLHDRIEKRKDAKPVANATPNNCSAF